MGGREELWGREILPPPAKRETVINRETQHRRSLKQNKQQKKTQTYKPGQKKRTRHPIPSDLTSPLELLDNIPPNSLAGNASISCARLAYLNTPTFSSKLVPMFRFTIITHLLPFMTFPNNSSVNLFCRKGTTPRCPVPVPVPAVPLCPGAVPWVPWVPVPWSTTWCRWFFLRTSIHCPNTISERLILPASASLSM